MGKTMDHFFQAIYCPSCRGPIHRVPFGYCARRIPIFVVGLLTILISLLSACGTTATANGPNQVHMNASIFEQSSITIKKGQQITLVNDTAEIHIIENGTW